MATLQMGPETIVVTVSVGFKPGLDSGGVQNAVTQINQEIKALDTHVKRVFVEAERREDHFDPSTGPSQA